MLAQSRRLVRPLFALVLLASLATAAVAQVPVEPSNISLKELAGTSTLVTVVIRGGAQDANYRVAEVTPTYIALVSEQGQRVPYAYDSIERIIVQGGKVERQKIDLGEDRQLRAEELRIFERALARAHELFNGSQDNQTVRETAATLLASQNDVPALTYLLQLVTSQDTTTEVRAAQKLYEAGFAKTPKEGTPKAAALAEAVAQLAADEPFSIEATMQRVILAGLDSGNRTTRANAAILAGVSGTESAIPVLNRMFQDRAAELSAPAAVALSRLGVEEARPRLIEMLTDANETRRMAATIGLIQLDSPGLVEALEGRAKDQTDPIARFQYGVVLYHLGSDQGKNLLRDTIRNVPTLADPAAIILAEDGDWDAMDIVRQRLSRRVNENVPENIAMRAGQAAALVSGGDASGIVALQDLLRNDNPGVVTLACLAIIDVGRPNLLTILQPNIESLAPLSSSMAITAAFALADPDLRARLEATLNIL